MIKPYKLLLILLFYGTSLLPTDSAVTVAGASGRFGDHLVMFIKGKWIAYLYDLPFLYKPFKYSDQLMLHKREKPFDSRNFKRVIKINTNSISIQPQTLYEVKYPAHIEDIISRDCLFIEELKASISPIHPIQLLDIPAHTIKIAVHVRRGSGFDSPLFSEQEYKIPNRGIQYSDRSFPLKFPPLQYYIDQLKNIASFFNGQPLYVHIFTDDSHPADLVKKIREAVNISSITYDFFNEDDRHNKNVLEDFFIMAKQFDILIRGGSNFSCVADLIGEHKIVIRPIETEWIENILFVKKVVTVAKDQEFAQKYNIPYQNEEASFFTT